LKFIICIYIVELFISSVIVFYASTLVKFGFGDRIDQRVCTGSVMTACRILPQVLENVKIVHVVKLNGTNAILSVIVIREWMIRVIGRWVVLGNRRRHLIYTLGKNPEISKGKMPYRNIEINERNFTFYFYLKINECRMQVYFEKLFNRDLFHSFLISWLAIIWILYEKNRQRKNFDIFCYWSKLIVKTCHIQLLQLKCYNLYSAIKCKFTLKINFSNFRNKNNVE